MAPTKGVATAASRRSPRFAKDHTAATPIADDNRITKTRAPPKTPRINCSTCDRTLAATAFYKRHATNNCKHDVHTCKSCLKSWITMQLESTTYDKLSCPECPEIMQAANVKAFATKETYAKYDELERRAIQDNTPGWRWCLSPTCRAGQVHSRLVEAEGEAVGKAKKGGKKKAVDDVCVCNECGHRACVPCDRPFHEEETCAQFQKRVKRQNGAEEKATLTKIEKTCKPCPKCEKNIEKDGGCDQVQCTQCYESFCWLCSTTYSVINKSGHAAGCTYAKPGRIDPHAAPNAPGNNLNNLNAINAPVAPNGHWLDNLMGQFAHLPRPGR